MTTDKVDGLANVAKNLSALANVANNLPYLTETDDRPLRVRLEQLRDALHVELILRDGQEAVRAWAGKLAIDCLAVLAELDAMDDALTSARLASYGRDRS